MHEVRHDRDKNLPPPKQLGPGERIVAGRRLYSAAWLDAPGEIPDARDIEPGEAGVKTAAEPSVSSGLSYCLHTGLEGGRVTSMVFTATGPEGLDDGEILPAILEIARRLRIPPCVEELKSRMAGTPAEPDDAEGLDGRGASKADLELRARARAAREVIRENPDVDRLGVLSLAIWPSPKLLAYYG